jgi:hypothetical protein
MVISQKKNENCPGQKLMENRAVQESRKEQVSAVYGSGLPNTHKELCKRVCMHCTAWQICLLCGSSSNGTSSTGSHFASAKAFLWKTREDKDSQLLSRIS